MPVWVGSPFGIVIAMVAIIATIALHLKVARAVKRSDGERNDLATKLTPLRGREVLLMVRSNRWVPQGMRQGTFDSERTLRQAGHDPWVAAFEPIKNALRRFGVELEDARDLQLDLALGLWNGSCSMFPSEAVAIVLKVEDAGACWSCLASGKLPPNWLATVILYDGSDKPSFEIGRRQIPRQFDRGSDFIKEVLWALGELVPKLGISMEGTEWR